MTESVVITGTTVEGSSLYAEIVESGGGGGGGGGGAFGRFFRGYPWRFVITDLVSVPTTWASGLLTNRHVLKTLGDACVITADVRPDDARVNTIHTDGYPLIAPTNRLIYAFRREGGPQPWKCRAAGIIMQPDDEGDPDVPLTHLTAYDPRGYLDARPVMKADGELPGPGGFHYFATADAIICEMLRETILSEGGVFIDAGPANGGTIYWDGTIEECQPLAYDVSEGSMIGQEWKRIEGMGVCDIILKPIYDPVRRPGFTHELSIYNLAGVDRPGAIFGWDRLNRCVSKITRSHLLTAGEFFDKVQYFVGQGGSPIPATGPLVNTDAVDAYGSWWSQQFSPSQDTSGGLGLAAYYMAQQAIRLHRQGTRTLTLDVIPERAPIPLVAYDIGDRVPVHASRRLRVTSDGYQRVQVIPINIGDDDYEVVSGLITAPDWREAAPVPP